jgi:hypothetical protein
MNSGSGGSSVVAAAAAAAAATATLFHGRSCERARCGLHRVDNVSDACGLSNNPQRSTRLSRMENIFRSANTDSYELASCPLPGRSKTREDGEGILEK